jgi:hypothetical protein
MHVLHTAQRSATHLVDAQVWVWADDRAPAEVDSLSTKVAPEAALLALEPLHKPPAVAQGPEVATGPVEAALWHTQRCVRSVLRGAGTLRGDSARYGHTVCSAAQHNAANHSSAAPAQRAPHGLAGHVVHGRQAGQV